jgi:Mg/Co/Ni transporter MgtE
MKAMQLMEERKIRHIPVFDGDSLVGMMSIKDIIATLMNEHDNEMASMADYINVSY